jgi:hypothetical protein
MRPHIDYTEFGLINIDGKIYEHDVLIRINGKIEKRKKKLSKKVYGTSHTISLDEAEYIFEEGAEQLIIGCGQYGVLELSPEAMEFFRKKKVEVIMDKTPASTGIWNSAKVDSIGLFHVTC